MSKVALSLVAVWAVLISAALTGRFRRFALTRGLLDVPNERSSHVTPTPRGGGVAIVITVLLALPLLYALHGIQNMELLGLFGAGALAAAVGYADDRGLITLRPRLAAHFGAAIIVVGCIGVGSISNALALSPSLSWLAAVLGTLYVVWMLNLTNFMDGIDGLASTQIITVCLGGALCAYLSLHALSSAIAGALVLAFATAGFLVWNWPPAKIFMGDAGSGFLGVTLASLSLIAGNESPPLFWAWLILSGVFIVDATITLFVRIGRHEAFYMAHRSHAYQHAAQRFTHRRVTLSVALINIVWLLPLSIVATEGRVNAPLALVIAYAPLTAIAIAFRAGQPNSVTVE
jgi:Fuc2NAc and GlcNAc transferase